MDDPWGSPWADEAQFQGKDDGQQKEDSTSITEVPVAAATLDFVAATSSPWGDDRADEDDFGEWSSMPAGASTIVESDVARTTLPDQYAHSITTRHENSSTGWTHTQDSIPADSAASNPVAEITFQPSPDPWSEVLTDDTDTTETYFHSVPVADQSAKDSNQRAEQSRKPSVSSQSSQRIAVGKARDHKVGENVSNLESSIPTSDSLGPTNLDITPVSPRSSTSQSVRSRHEEVDQHETPRTSSDDEHSRPPMPRKASSRIQPLIEHFDGLSKEEASLEPSTTSSVANTHDAINQNNTEGAIAAKLVAALYVPHSGAQLLDKTPSRNAGHSRQSSSGSESSPEINSALNFEVDITILNKLFSSASQDTSSEDVFIPDVVPYESFTSMDQRKTWYRVSRYGSVLKHDSGDDDSYARVTWMGSRVHDETIKIVARWMEEDRLSGQVMLGGTGRTSALFGWGDAKAPAVSLDAVFAARHDKRQSLGVEKHTDTAPLDNRVSGDVGKDNGKQTERPVASFGWDDDTSTPASSERAPHPVYMGVGNRSPIKPPISQPPTYIDTTQGPRSTTSSEAEPSMLEKQHKSSNSSFLNSEKLEVDTAEEEEEEDDWGEMVSTPVEEGRPISLPLEHSDTVEPGLAKSAPSHAILGLPSGTFLLPEIGTLESDSEATSYARGGHSPQAAVSTSSLNHAEIQPWTTTDFSLFDSVSHRPQQPPSAETTIPRPASPVRSRPVRPSPLKQVTFSADDFAPHSTNSKTKGSQETLSANEERLLRTIIEGLPDLSYMLKR